MIIRWAIALGVTNERCDLTFFTEPAFGRLPPSLRAEVFGATLTDVGSRMGGDAIEPAKGINAAMLYGTPAGAKEVEAKLVTFRHLKDFLPPMPTR